MKIRNLLSAVAAAGIVVAPVAAQAGTSAASSTVNAAAISGVSSRESSMVTAEQDIDAGTLLLIILALIAAGWGLKEIIEGTKTFGSGSTAS